MGCNQSTCMKRMLKVLAVCVFCFLLIESEMFACRILDKQTFDEFTWMKKSAKLDFCLLQNFGKSCCFCKELLLPSESV